MTILYIDNREIELDEMPDLCIGISLSEICSPDHRKTGRTVKVVAPMSAVNRRALGFPEQILSPELFNKTARQARIEIDGVVVASGHARLTECRYGEGSQGLYMFEIVSDERKWLSDAARTHFKDLPIPFADTISGTMVADSWTNDSAIKFFPVERDRYSELEFETEVPSVRALTYEDYHPFLNIRKAMDAIAENSGYTISSSFLDSPFFRSLYMSGNYPTRSISLIKNRMNFFAGRLRETTVLANRYGSVLASPYEPLNSIGNLVDTANAFESLDGYRIEGAFNNNNCFKKIDARPAFVAADDISIAFEYRLVYRTNYEIVSHTRMKGFDEIVLHDGSRRNINITNTLTDKRNNVTLTGKFTVVVMETEAVLLDNHSLVYRDTNNALQKMPLQARICYVDLVGATVVGIERSANGSVDTSVNGWAIYSWQDYIEATIHVLVDVTVRSNPMKVTRNQKVFFDTVRFSGAPANTQLIMLRDTSIRPVFYVNPMDGSQITTRDIFAHDKKLSSMFDAVSHMFRLCFYTDELTKTLYIEPYDSFFRNNIVDWTSKTDNSKPVMVEERGSDMARTITMSYINQDGTVTRWNESNKAKYACWTTNIDNAFARNEESEDVNPLFAPTMNTTMSFPQARSASMIQAGDRNRYGNNYDDGNLNFTPKVVSFMGMKQLPSGQNWGWPSYGKSYPLVAFHHTDVGENFTLCYDDYQGQSGLNRYHKRYLSAVNNGKVMTAYINLTLYDIDSILHPNSSECDMRALFRINIHGENILCRLHSVENFAPDSGESTKCVFIKE